MLPVRHFGGRSRCDEDRNTASRSATTRRTVRAQLKHSAQLALERALEMTAQLQFGAVVK
jgi:hypothetical protein